MAFLKFLKGDYANLNKAAINEGQILICNDTAEMFVDVAADKRIKIGDFTVVANLTALEALDATSVPTSRLYYVEDGNILARSNGTSWIQVNKQPTIAELKVQLGLGDLAYKSEVAEADLNADLAAKINAASGAQHTHDNQTVLDGITAEKVAAWDVSEQNAKDYADDLDEAMDARVQALEAIDHSHTFVEAELNKIADGDVAKWDAAAEKAHAHTFVESELNKIADGDVAKWNAAEKNAKDYADGLDGAMNTRVEALETAIGENGSVATQIKTAIEALDFTDVAVDGEYVSAVNEVDGKISVTRKALPDYSNTYDAKGAADTAFENAKAYADGLAANYDEKGAAAGVKTELEAEIAKKVDKVEGKSLIADTEITRLAGMSDGANKVEASANNGSIKIDGVETVVYTHPATHTVSEISDFDEKVKAYDYATKTEAQAMADGKDEAIAAAKKAGDDAQDAIDAYVESNNTALAGVKAIADAAAVKSDVDAALAERYTKTEADGKFAVKGEDSYDDTVLAGRVTTAEGKITALETESAKHATKDELAGVDAKFADYTKTADLPTDLGDFTNNAGYAKTADVNTELDKKADKTQVATDISNAIAPLATTEALNGVDAKFANYTNTTDMNAKFDLKADKTQVATDIANAIAPLATTEALNGVKATAEAAATKQYTDEELAKKADKSVVDAMYTNEQIDAAILVETNRAKEAEEGLQTQINTIMNNPDAEGAINSINEFTQYVKDHGTIADGFRVDIDKNKEDIAANTKAIGDEAARADAAEKALAGRLDTLEAIDHDAYVAADSALKSELEGKISDGDAATLEAAKIEASNQDAVVLSEAQKYTDAAKADAIADAASKYETIGTAQGIVDGLKLSETYEPIGAEGRAIAEAGELDAALKEELQGEINAKANSADVYTKAEVDTLFTWGEF